MSATYLKALHVETVSDQEKDTHRAMTLFLSIADAETPLISH
jgi:hypothetical protein